MAYTQRLYMCPEAMTWHQPADTWLFSDTTGTQTATCAYCGAPIYRPARAIITDRDLLTYSINYIIEEEPHWAPITHP